ncbi:hypothetical protein Tco_1244042 [Tanacetum coccineum]
MSTPVNTSSTDSQMHNNIMAAGSKDRPPMLGPGRYSQWRSRFLRVLIQAVPEAEGRPAVQQHTAIETVLNMTPENKEHFQSEKEAIFLLLTGIGDEIYSTVDACNTANEMWIAIERLQQGESLNVQDVKTNLFWEFGKFTSQDGESMESYYSRFYKLMNELTRNNLQVTTMQVNVQFLQQLQPEWSRFVTMSGKQKNRPRLISQMIDILEAVSTGRFNDIILTSQHQKPQRSNATSSSTRKRCILPDTKGKEAAQPITPQSDVCSMKKDIDPNKLRGQGNGKEIGTPCLKYFKKLYKPTQQQLRKLQTPRTRLKIPHQDALARGTDEEIDEQELEAHYSYMAKIQDVSPEGTSSTGQPLEQVDQNAAECVDERAALANLIANLTLDTEENKMILKQLKKANASLTQELEKCKTNLDETNSALGEAISCRDSCLICPLLKQNEFEKYKAFNDRTIDYEILQTKLNETLGLLALKDIEIKEGLKTKAYEISVLNQKHDELVKKSLLTKSQLEGYLKENTKVISDLKVKEEKDIDKMIEMDKQPTFANPRYLKKAQSEKPCLYEIPFDTSDPANRFAPDREETMTLDNESRSKLNKDYVKPYDYTKQNSLYEIFKAPSLEYLYQLERAKEVRKTM